MGVHEEMWEHGLEALCSLLGPLEHTWKFPLHTRPLPPPQSPLPDL